MPHVLPLSNETRQSCQVSNSRPEGIRTQTGSSPKETRKRTLSPRKMKTIAQDCAQLRLRDAVVWFGHLAVYAVALRIFQVVPGRSSTCNHATVLPVIKEYSYSIFFLAFSSMSGAPIVQFQNIVSYSSCVSPMFRNSS